MDRNQIRKIIFIFFLLGLLFFNRLEMFDPLAGFSFSQEIYDRNGKLMRLTLSEDDQYRVYRSLNEIDPGLQEAVLLSEDQYFYRHWGVNPISLVRAFFSLRESRPYGGSTITMQMVRLRDRLYTKNFSGKVWQILSAVRAEFLYSKRQILMAYLNLTPYGANIEGVGAASLIYFSKNAIHLSAPEALLLAVIPQNPVRRNLQGTDQAIAFTARDRLAVKKGEKNQAALDLKIPLLSQKIAQLPFKAPHFANYVVSQVGHENRKALKTTLDLRIQELLEARLRSYIKTKAEFGIKNGAVILIEKETRQIKAWVGSKDFFDEKIQGQIDGVTTARSPGSALKPFLYALALEEGLIHPQSVLYDTPSSFGLYDPENFDRGYKGALSAEEALIQSRNVPAIYLASRLKKKSLWQLLSQAHITFPQNEKYYGLAMALGAAEVTPLDLAGLYTALGNRGQFETPNWRLGESLVPTDLLSAESSFMVLSMLKKNVRSISPLLDQIGKEKFPIAWKTGTSYGYRDAWVAGVIGDHVLVVWLGDFDNSSNPALVGREMAAPLFFEIVDLLYGKAFIKKDGEEFPLGLNVKEAEVCALTGGFSNGTCPHLKKTWFSPGVSPIDDCHVHREFLISTRTGKRICRADQSAYSRREVFDFWPSDIVQMFIQYGLPYKKAPPFEQGCDSQMLGQLAAPVMISPKSDLSYSVRFDGSKGFDKIPFRVKVDQEVKKVFWFANNQPLGEVAAGETLFAELVPGDYEIRAVDNFGQIAERSVQVKLVR